MHVSLALTQLSVSGLSIDGLEYVQRWPRRRNPLVLGRSLRGISDILVPYHIDDADRRVAAVSGPSAVLRTVGTQGKSPVELVSSEHAQ